MESFFRRPVSEDLGRLVLRVAVGGMMLVHGYEKARYGIDLIVELVQERGLPVQMAYGVYLGEIVAPVLMILGWYSRPAALVVAMNMVVAVMLAHRNDIFKLSPHGGWAIELPAFYFFGAIAVFMLGAGRFSATKGRGAFH